MADAIDRKDIATDDALKVPYDFKKGFDDASLSVENFAAQLDKLITKSIQQEKVLASGTSTRKLNQETVNLTLAQQELFKIQKQITTVQARNNAEYIKETKVLDSVKKSLKEKTALGDRDARTINAQNASIKELGAALIKNRAAYESLTSAEERNSEEGKSLLAVIQAQDADLKALKDSVGQNYLEVGKYDKALKGLKDQLKAAKDEMAGIAAELGTGSAEFIEASQKAGELQDQMNGINDAAKALSASPFENIGNSLGQVGSKLKNLDFKGASVAAKQLVGATKAMTFKEAIAGAGDFGKTMLSLGKALLLNPLFLIASVVIGIGAAMLKLKDVSPLVSKGFDIIGDAIDRVVQIGKDFLDWIGLTTFAADEKAAAIIDGAKKEIDAISKRYDQEIKIVSAAGKETLDLEIKKNKDVIAEATKGLVALDGIRRRYNGKLNEEQQKAWDEYVAIIAEANTEIQALQAAHDKEMADKAKERALREQGDAFKLAQFLLQNQIEKNKRLAENEQANIDDRIAASEEVDKLRRELAKLEKDYALKEEDLTASGRKAIYAKFQQDLTDITREGAETRNALTKEVIDEDRKNLAKRIEDQKKAIQEEAEIRTRALDNEIEAIQKAVLDGNLTRKEGDKEIADAKKAFLDDQVRIEIEAMEKVLNIQGLSAEEQAIIQKQLFKLRKDLTEAYYEQVGEGEKSLLDQMREVIPKIQELYQGFTGAISNMFSSVTERRLQELDAESAANEEALDEQLEREEKAVKQRLANELLTDEQKKSIEEVAEARKAALQKEAERREQQIEARRRKEARKAAILNKAIALGEAVIAGALAVVKALPAIPLAIAVGAIAAINIAAIAARPIPAAAKGMKNHKGGPILVGEKGAELYFTPKGVGLTPSTATVMDLPANTEVVTHNETMRRLAGAGLAASDLDRRPENNKEVVGILKKINHTIENKKEVSVEGRVTGYRQGGSHVKYVDSLRNK